MERRVVGQKSVGLLAVLTKPFSVISRDYNECPIEHLGSFKHPQNRAQTLIGIGNFALVQAMGKQLVIGRRRDMWMVWVPVVQPHKEGIVQVLTQPGQDGVVDMARRSLVIPARVPWRGGTAEQVLAIGSQVVVVEYKSLGGTKLLRKREATDRRAGSIALGGQDLREGLALVWKMEKAIVPYPMDQWIGPGQNRRVGGLCHRIAGYRPFEQKALGSQAIKRWG